MEDVTSCFIHEGITRKLVKCSYMENKEAISQGMHAVLFMYFPAANC